MMIRNRMGKPTHSRFALGLTDEQLQKEYDLIKEKKSPHPRGLRDRIVFIVESGFFKRNVKKKDE